MAASSTKDVPPARVRPARTDDHFPDDVPAPRPDQDDLRWRRALVAVTDDGVIGAASLALAPATDSYFCEINVAAPHRRRGVGTLLYQEIRRLRAEPFPVLARAMQSRPMRRAFADALGATVRIRCPEPWVEPATPAARRWIAEQQLPPGYRTVPMNGQPENAVLRAWTSYYVWAHQPFGSVRPDQVPITWEGGYSQGLDRTASMITLDRADDIVAFSLVSPEVWDGRTMIVSETVDRDQVDGVDLLTATVAASLEVLAENGIGRVELEGHTTDPHSSALVDSIPTSGGDPMDILQLGEPNS